MPNRFAYIYTALLATIVALTLAGCNGTSMWTMATISSRALVSLATILISISLRLRLICVSALIRVGCLS